MPRKKVSKGKIVKKVYRKKTRSKTDNPVQGMKHFEEEVETLGERFEKRVDKESRKCGN